jgi:hypothetical protein
MTVLIVGWMTPYVVTEIFNFLIKSEQRHRVFDVTPYK